MASSYHALFKKDRIPVSQESCPIFRLQTSFWIFKASRGKEDGLKDNNPISRGKYLINIYNRPRTNIGLYSLVQQLLYF